MKLLALSWVYAPLRSVSINCLLLLKQISTNVIIENKAHLLSYSSVGRKFDASLTGLKSKFQQGCVPFWRLEGQIHYLSFLVSRGVHVSWPTASSFHLQRVQCYISLAIFPQSDLPLTSSFSLPLPLLRMLVIMLGPPALSLVICWLYSQLISNLNSICYQP